MIRLIHVIPVGDVDLHCAQLSCWCYPGKNEDGLIVHNARDAREAQERITNEKCSEGWVLIREEIEE